MLVQVRPERTDAGTEKLHIMSFPVEVHVYKSCKQRAIAQGSQNQPAAKRARARQILHTHIQIHRRTWSSHLCLFPFKRVARYNTKSTDQADLAVKGVASNCLRRVEAACISCRPP